MRTSQIDPAIIHRAIDDSDIDRLRLWRTHPVALYREDYRLRQLLLAVSFLARRGLRVVNASTKAMPFPLDAHAQVRGGSIDIPLAGTAARAATEHKRAPLSAAIA